MNSSEKRWGKKLSQVGSIFLSLLILLVIYLRIDFSNLLQTFKDSNKLGLLVSLGMVIPITLLITLRFQQLFPPTVKISFNNAISLILAGSSLNMILPSKMGDIAKAFFMKKKGLSRSFALSLVIFEKVCDMLSLLLFCLFGLVLYMKKDLLFFSITPIIIFGLVIGISLLRSKKLARIIFILGAKITPKRLKTSLEKVYYSWLEMQKHFFNDKLQLLKITFISICIWFLHLLQIWGFIIALNAWVPFLYNLAIAPLSILVGLLPITFAGIGARDAAIIMLYKPFFNESVGAALGLLCTMRYLVPAVFGTPFIGHYMLAIKNSEI